MGVLGVADVVVAVDVDCMASALRISCSKGVTGSLSDTVGSSDNTGSSSCSRASSPPEAARSELSGELVWSRENIENVNIFLCFRKNLAVNGFKLSKRYNITGDSHHYCIFNDSTWGKGVNSLAPGKFAWNFRYVIFKQILVIDGWGISCEIALIWMSLDFTDGQSTLVQVMAWCRQATSHYLSQCWPRSLLPYGVTRP